MYPIREGNNLAAGNFASVWQSLQHCKTPEWFQMQVWDVGSLGAAVPTLTERLVWEIYKEEENNI